MLQQFSNNLFLYNDSKEPRIKKNCQTNSDFIVQILTPPSMKIKILTTKNCYLRIEISWLICERKYIDSFFITIKDLVPFLLAMITVYKDNFIMGLAVRTVNNDNFILLQPTGMILFLIKHKRMQKISNVMGCPCWTKKEIYMHLFGYLEMHYIH